HELFARARPDLVAFHLEASCCVSKPEERFDPAEDALLLDRLAILARPRVEAVAHGDQLDAAMGELLRQLLGDLRAIQDDALERLLAEPEALDLARRDDVGEPWLAGHQAHLAEDL